MDVTRKFARGLGRIPAVVSFLFLSFFGLADRVRAKFHTESRCRLCIFATIFLGAFFPGHLQAQTAAPVIIAPFTTLNSFTGTNGVYPLAGLIQGSDGNFYGTTEKGGSSLEGTVFKVTPSGSLTTLCSFTGANGDLSDAGLIQSSNGNFYGTTEKGGSSGEGTVFEVTPSGTLTTLRSFTGTNGQYP